MSINKSAGHENLIASREAAELLGVSLASLYSYVSRNLLHPVRVETGGSRAKRYRRVEVERLARRHAAARKPLRAAGVALDMGFPVLESGISLIDDGRLYYRGHDATVLAGHASLEDIAALLWECDPSELTGTAQGLAPGTRAALARSAHLPMPQRMQRGFQRIVGDELWSSTASTPNRLSWSCVEAMLMAATGRPVHDAQMPVHERLRLAWKLPASAAPELRRALVLCADHELNASSFTARCVASTGADARASVTAALAALSGPRHGGMIERVEDIWAHVAARATAQVLRRWLLSQAGVPGFGHGLYPSGDPRAKALLDRLPPNPRLQRFIAAVREHTGQAPVLDFGLVALRRELGAPDGAAFAILAIARTVGWLAHAFEQQRSGTLIRPRAAYVGPRPWERAVSGRRAADRG